MKLDTNVFQEKPPSLEEGSMRYGNNNNDLQFKRVERSNIWKICIQLLKVSLYFELVLFIGWLGCILLSNYYWERRSLDAVHDGPYDLPTWSAEFNNDELSIQTTTMDDIVTISTTAIATETLSSAETAINDSNETDITPSWTFRETKEPDLNMLLSQWLELVRMPILDNDDDDDVKLDWQRRFETTDDGQRKIITWAEEDNDKFDSASSDSANEETNDESALLSAWPNLMWGFEYIGDIDHETMNFDEYGKYIDNILDRRARAINAKDESDSSSSSSEEDTTKASIAKRSTESSSSEETKPAPKTKRSTESSSSEETKPAPKVERSADSSSSEETIPESKAKRWVYSSVSEESKLTPKDKRSVDSSSSEETKPAPKAKRSAESSSSESENEDEKDNNGSSDSSSDSSSSEESSSKKSDKDRSNCPTIFAEDGTPITDVEAITDFFKRNWIKEILSTPVPDCGRPKAAKTLTVDKCGRFVVKCTLPTIQNEKSNEDDTNNHRKKRFVDEFNGIPKEICDVAINSTHEKLKNLTSLVIDGDSSDPIITELRDIYESVVVLLTFQMTASGGLFSVLSVLKRLESNTTASSSKDISDENVMGLMATIKQEVLESTDSQHQEKLNISAVPTQEAIDQFRDTIQLIMRDLILCGGMISSSPVYKDEYDQMKRRNQSVTLRKREADWADSTIDFVPNCYVPDENYLKERQIRLENIAKINMANDPNGPYYKPVLDTFAALSNAGSMEEIRENVEKSRGLSLILITTQYLVSNATFEMQRQGYKLARDFFLETREFLSPSNEWNNYDRERFFTNFTNYLVVGIRNNGKSEVIFKMVLKIGQALGLSYHNLETKTSDTTETLTFGEFTYNEPEPEPLCIRHVRHLLNEFVKFYFSLQKPCALATDDNATAESQTAGINDDVISSRNRRSIKNPIRKFENSVNNDTEIHSNRNEEYQDFDSSLEYFYDKMDILAAHIDRLHERYMQFNELNDDYVSREFPVESTLTDESKP